jgi:hypothetical protein
MARSNIAADILDQSKLKPQIEETYRVVYYNTANDNERLSEMLKCQLKEIVNQLNTVETISECEKLISDKINDNIVLITNCSNSHDTEEIINRVSHYHHISTIYIINDHHPHRYKTVDISIRTSKSLVFKSKTSSHNFLIINVIVNDIIHQV